MDTTPTATITPTAIADAANMLRVTLAVLIEDRGFSIRKLGQQAGVGHATISEFLSGKSKSLSLDNLAKLAAVFNLDIGELFSGERGELRLVEFKRLFLNSINPRRHADKDRLADLARSIETIGLLVPLIVRQREDPPDTFEIVAGDRRYAAVSNLIAGGRLAKDYRIPVRVVKADDLQAMLMALTENLARDDMHPLDEGGAFTSLKHHSMSSLDIAAEVGRTEFLAGKITLAQAEALCDGDDGQQKHILGRIFNGEHALATEAGIRAALAPPPADDRQGDIENLAPTVQPPADPEPLETDSPEPPPEPAPEPSDTDPGGEPDDDTKPTVRPPAWAMLDPQIQSNAKAFAREFGCIAETFMGRCGSHPLDIKLMHKESGRKMKYARAEPLHILNIEDIPKGSRPPETIRVWHSVAGKTVVYRLDK